MNSTSCSYPHRKNSLLIGRRNSLFSIQFPENGATPSLVQTQEEYITNFNIDDLIDLDSYCANFDTCPVPYNYVNTSQSKRSSLAIPLSDAQQSKRCSLGISMADLKELTGEYTRPSVHKRSSLDMLFSSAPFDSATKEDEDIPKLHVVRRSSIATINPTMVSAGRQHSLHPHVSEQSYVLPSSIESQGIFQPNSECRGFLSSSRQLSDRLSVSPFHPCSPHFSPAFSRKYAFYLQSLVYLMEKSERSRRDIRQVKMHLKRQQQTMTNRISYSEIKSSRRKKREAKTNGASIRQNPTSAKGYGRRRSSVAVHMFKTQYFPEGV